MKRQKLMERNLPNSGSKWVKKNKNNNTLISFQVWAVEATLHQDDEYNLKQSKLLASAKTTAFIYRDYIYGAVVNLTILEVIKCVVGSPRPTFFDLCAPEEAKTCNE